jgi:putative chitinase
MNLNEKTIATLLASNPNPQAWLAPLQTVLPKFGITTPEQVAAFIAQTTHESANYTRLVENLNYSAQGLMTTWPSRFKTLGYATGYARQPIKIANLVYSNRLGNGSELSGDGWKYRGRGLIQLTGKENYRACSLAMYGDDRLLTNPDLLTLPEGALTSACWFWNQRKLNTILPKGIDAVSVAINGGKIGLHERAEKFNAALKVLKG